MAWYCDGTNDAAQFASNAIFNPANITVAFCAKVRSGHGNAQFDRLLECGGFAENAGWGFEFGPLGTGIAPVLWNNVPASANVGSHFGFTVDTWHYYALTSSTTGPISKFYADATQVGGDNTTFTRTTTTKGLTLAARHNDPTQNRSAYEIKHLMVFNSVLSQSDISLLNPLTTFDQSILASAVFHAPCYYDPSQAGISNLNDIIVPLNAAVTGSWDAVSEYVIASQFGLEVILSPDAPTGGKSQVIWI